MVPDCELDSGNGHTDDGRSRPTGFLEWAAGAGGRVDQSETPGALGPREPWGNGPAWVRQNQVRGEKIFNREPQGLEHCDLAGTLPAWKFTQFRGDVLRSPSAFSDSHHHVARFLKRSSSRVNH